jgi:YVTN family beta-propeller protein
MKKKILIPVGMAALFLCASWQEAETTVSPDRLFLADNGKSLFVTNRAGCELIKMSPDGQKMEKKVSFSSPVNAMTQDANGKLWVVCDGNYGTMYELDGKKLSVQSKTKSGATPSDILYNPLSKSLWVTQRFNNELWEIDPATRKVKTKIAVGREPVSMAAFASDSPANV